MSAANPALETSAKHRLLIWSCTAAGARSGSRETVTARPMRKSAVAAAYAFPMVVEAGVSGSTMLLTRWTCRPPRGALQR